jgi:teichuronic acid biosynthesis glycosyltransferase TuaG
MDKISVIIPYFKKIAYINKTLMSVSKQTYKNIEIIIIFDDQDQIELEKIKSYIKKKKIRLIINSKNLGAGVSRNKGASIAKGKYLAFLDADDIWTPNKLSYQLRFMKKLKLKFSHTSYFIIDEYDKKIGFREAKFLQSYDDLLNSCDIGLSSVMIERKLFLKNKFSSNITKEDYFAWLKISKKYPIYGINKYLTSWRKTRGSLSSNTTQKIIDAFDVYYNKQKFGIIKSIFRVLNLSFNYLVKRYL